MNARAKPAAPPLSGSRSRAASDSGPTKREANKQEKLRRIQHAADELFELQGYDNTTMREIAIRAEVALGTLFLYASNKRDLLFVIANDIMIGAVGEAAALVDDSETLTHNLMLVAGVHLRVFGAQPGLFRLVLRELLFYDSGVQALRATENRRRLMALYQRLVSNAAHAGEIRPAIDAEMAAQIFHAIIQAEIRRWIATDDPVLSSGLAALWAAFTLVVEGLAERPQPAKAPAAELRKIMERLSSP